MLKKRVLTDDLIVGMRLFEDVITQEGQLLVVKGTEITPRIITRLKFYGIHSMDIEPDIVEKPQDIGSYMKIEATEEFRKFDSTLHHAVNNLENTISDAILSGKEIDTWRLLATVDTIVTDAGNGLHLMSMLQCIRGYDDLIYVHSINVALICNVMGTWLNMSEEDKRLLTVAGLLHDIGKTMIPKELLSKQDKLTDEEYQIVQSHALKGYELIRDKNIDVRIKLAILQHHERCDGKGYPLGLPGDKVIDFAKIIAIADVYDAMTANRSYRRGICPFDVIDTFEKDGYQKYDPKFLLTFLQRISQGYLNTKVILSDGRNAEIIMLNNSQLSKPVVRVGDEYINLAEKPGLTVQSLL